jgi:drug/metabolite transporter (DMT)-like permease
MTNVNLLTCTVLKKFAEGAHANAVVFSFFRDGCCFPVLLIAAALLEGGCKFPKSAKELGVFCMLGVTGMWGNQLFYILGLYYTSATIASCWQPAIPVFAAFFAIILRVEPFPPLAKFRGWLKLLGILCAAGGALVLTLGKPEHKTSADAAKQATLGNFFLLMNCSCMALYINIQKVFIFRNDKEPGAVGSIWVKNPVHITAWSYFFGAIAMIITAVVGNALKVDFLGFNPKKDPNAWDIPKPMFIGLVYAVFVSSGELLVETARRLPASPDSLLTRCVRVCRGVPAWLSQLSAMA